MCSAQTEWETSADGTEFMDTTLKALKSSLEAIRDMAMKALNQIEQSQEEHSMRWKCKACSVSDVSLKYLIQVDQQSIEYNKLTITGLVIECRNLI